jgi:hypothetical protein
MSSGQVHSVVILLALMLPRFGDDAAAFTVQFGRIPASEERDSARATTGADIPTPQMFGVRLGPGGMTLGPMLRSPEDTDTAPAVRFQPRPEPQPDDAHQTPQARTTTAPRHLSDVEVLLLRQADTVADRQRE